MKIKKKKRLEDGAPMPEQVRAMIKLTRRLGAGAVGAALAFATSLRMGNDYQINFLFIFGGFVIGFIVGADFEIGGDE